MIKDMTLGPQGEYSWALASPARRATSPRTRHAELLILCARIGFNP